MLRSFTIQPLSLVLGVVFSAVVLLSMSQAPPLNARGIVVQYGPEPRDMVQISEGAPYVVPAGKLFVLTAVGGTNWVQVQLRLDGQPVLIADAGLSALSTTGTSMVAPPPGFTAPGGTTVDILRLGGSSGPARAWGYLAPQ
jgi:hypothetical protein